MGHFVKTERTKLQKTITKKLLVAVVTGMLFLLIATLSMIIDPILVIAKYRSRAAYGSSLHDVLKTGVDSVHLSMYLFNVTNAERFQNGEDRKLRVQEVGPFTYREMRYHDNLEFDARAGVMRYTPNIKIHFLPEESIDRPEDVNVTMPNIAMLSMASLISTFSYFPKVGFNLLTNRLKSKSIVSMSAQDYLWGYDEPLIKLSNTVLPNWINFDSLGVLDRIYDKKMRYRIEVGASDYDKFSIKSVNGSHGLKIWSYDDPNKRTKCNSFIDSYEGLGYPPELTPGKSFRIYRNVLCRFLEFDYYGKTTTDYGTDGLLYKMSNRTFTKNPDTECLCKEGVCFDGISDVSPCYYSLPLVLSNAHFLHADPKVYERVEGMKPNEKDHGSAIVIEPKIGMALKTLFSVQVNILVKDVSFNSETSKFSNMVIPVAYFKIEQPRLPDIQIYNLKLMYVIGPYLLLAIQIFLFRTGFSLLIYSIRVLYCSCVHTKENIAFHTVLSNKSSVEKPLIE